MLLSKSEGFTDGERNRIVRTIKKNRNLLKDGKYNYTKMKEKEPLIDYGTYHNIKKCKSDDKCIMNTLN